MNNFNIFKIEYYWYEGEHEETLLMKDVGKEEFEKDLIDAKKFAESLIGKEIKKGNYLGEGYNVACLPEFYEQIIWFLLEKKGYKECQFDCDISYIIEDNSDKEINIIKSEKITKREEISVKQKNQ
jgi:hypothetical protein